MESDTIQKQNKFLECLALDPIQVCFEHTQGLVNCSR